MSINYLVKAAAAFEKLAAFNFDLENAKTLANRLIPEMSSDEACGILNVDPSVTPELLELALKAKLIELREEQGFGSSKMLANKQHAIVKAFCVLEPVAEKNSYPFEDEEDLGEKTLQLTAKVALFETLAQKRPDNRVVLDPKKKNEVFWSNLLFNAIGSYANFLPSKKEAENKFKLIAAYKKSPAYVSDKEFRELESIEVALDEAQAKIKAAGLDPLQILKNKGMQNVNSNIFGILKSNLEVLKAGVDFNQYQHYVLVRPGEAHPNDVIELDRDDGPGY